MNKRIYNVNICNIIKKKKLNKKYSLIETLISRIIIIICYFGSLNADFN